MKKNLILMSALFAGSMIINSGFGAKLGETIIEDERDIKQCLSCTNVDDDNFGFTAEMISDNKDFKFKDSNSLLAFINEYHDNTKAVDLITTGSVSKINSDELLTTAYSIKKDNALQDKEKELVLDKIFTVLTDRDFKFIDYIHLIDFIEAYHKYTKAIDFITSARLFNIDANDLIETAWNIKTNGCYSYLQEQEKERILNEIFTTLTTTDRDFKFGDNWISLYNFIAAYHDNTNAMNIITSDSVSNISSDDLLTATYSIKKDNALQDKEKELILNKILNILTNRDFKFGNHCSLENFIRTYYNHKGALNLITSDKLSNIPNEQLEYLIRRIKRDLLPYADLFEKKDIQHVIDIIKQILHPFEILQAQEKLFREKIFTILNRDFKFESRDNLMSFINAYHEYANAMNIVTSNNVFSISSDELLTTAYSIKADNALQDQEKELILNEIFTILAADMDFKFKDRDSLMSFIRTYHEYTKAMNLITSSRLPLWIYYKYAIAMHVIPDNKIPISKATFLNSIRYLKSAFLTDDMSASEKENFQRVISIFHKKLLQEIPYYQ